MPGFRRRRLPFLLCCLFAGTQTAQAAVETARAAAPLNAAGAAREAVGEEPAGLDLPVDSGPVVKLRMERKFNVLAKKKPQQLMRDTGPVIGWSNLGLPGSNLPPAKPQKDDYPAFITADQLEGRADEVAEAEGNAEFRRNGQFLWADNLTYWPLEDEVEAVGHVRLKNGQDEISGPRMRMKLSEQIGYFDDADFKVSKEVTSRFYRPVVATSSAVSFSVSTGNAPMTLYVPSTYGLSEAIPARRPTESYGHAERIDFEGENHIKLSNATYSTCKPGDYDWFLKSDEIRLDYDKEVGESDQSVLYFKDVPIFYAPTGSFTLNNARRSGFLAGNFSASSKNGLDVTLPYYWYLAPNYDVTFYPRYMAKRGLQLGAEGQYMDYNYRGTLRFEFMPKDDLADRSRHAYSWVHSQNLGQGVSASVNWNKVSDDQYFNDFSSRLMQTSQTQLPQQLVLNWAPGTWWATNIQTLRYQTLQTSSTTTVERPYFLEPHVNFSGRLNNVLPKTDLTLVGQYSRFTHPDKVQGERTVAYPQLSMPWYSPSFVVVPKIGVHATQYSLDRQDAGVASTMTRVMPTFTLDSTVYFERDTDLLGHEFTQTLEPRLYYVYIPYRDQSKIPVFDSGLADFNFAQVFTENRYSGYDRINDANQVTAAVTSRFLDPETGAERFKAMVGQRYYFDEQRVSITGETVRAKNFSNFLAGFTGLILPKTYVDSAWEYNYHKSQSDRISAGVRYQPEMAKVISAGYRFARDAYGVGQVDQVDIAAQWPLGKGWYGVGRYNYSLRDKQLLEAIGGVEYNAGCWAARAVVQRLEAVGGTPNTTLFFQLELNDFANVGSNPLQLLRRSIPGYGKVNEMPGSDSLLSYE